MKIQIIRYDSVDSTNNVAIRRIKRGKVKPTLIIANSQKKGRGQYGRKWTSYRGNIFISIYFILRKKIQINIFIMTKYITLICEVFCHHFYLAAIYLLGALIAFHGQTP